MSHVNACKLWSLTAVISKKSSSVTSDGTVPFRATFRALAGDLPDDTRITAPLDFLAATIAFFQAMTVFTTSSSSPTSTLVAKMEAAEVAAQHYREATEQLASHVQAAIRGDGAGPDAALVQARDHASEAFQHAFDQVPAMGDGASTQANAHAAGASLARIEAAAEAFATTTGISLSHLHVAMLGDQAECDGEADRQACVAGQLQLHGHVDRVAACLPLLHMRCQRLLDVTVARDDRQMVAQLEVIQSQLRTFLMLRGPHKEDDTLSHILVRLPWRALLSGYVRRRHWLEKCVECESSLGARYAALRELKNGLQRATSEKGPCVAQLETTYKALKQARRLYLETRAAHEDSSDDEGEAVSPAQLDQRRASWHSAISAKDAAARSLYGLARAYFPELLVTCARRLGDMCKFAAWTERRLDSYTDRAPLAPAAGGRHVLIKAAYMGRPCVLKCVPYTVTQQTCREVDILSRLDHPSVVKLEAVFSEANQLYMQLPFACHGDLGLFLAAQADVAAAGPARVSASALRTMGRQLCEALAYLAERSVVHCDVKPANVLVDGEPDKLRAILGDFDVSHTASGRTASLTMALHTRGLVTHYSKGYAAPELLCAAEGAAPRATHKLDMFGLGCVIYHMHMYPRELREPKGQEDAVAGDDSVFRTEGGPGAPPCDRAWAAAVPIDVVRAATHPDARRRASARGLLQMPYIMQEAGFVKRVAVQTPAYWEHQEHAGSWLVLESADVHRAVEALMNRTAKPETHGVGRDSHQEPFARFKVTVVHRVENWHRWCAYAAQRRAIGDALAAEGYAPPAQVATLATAGFEYPLVDGTRQDDANEVFLFHGTGTALSIVGSGFDVRYAFAGKGAGACFGHGVYFAESASKADQYARRGGDGKLRMFLSRVCLGRTQLVTAPRGKAPFLPEVPGKSTAQVPVYHDSILADVSRHRFREVVVGKDTSAYAELLVEYERA